MAENQGKGRITFNCYFTSTVRHLFHQKRIELGLPYNRLADFFGVNWSTIRKWEMGPTKVSEVVFRPKIEGFINGDYDRILKSNLGSLNDDEELYEVPASSPIYQCMERVATAYQLCQHDDDITNVFLAELEEASRRAISKLVSQEFKEYLPSEKPSPRTIHVRKQLPPDFED